MDYYINTQKHRRPQASIPPVSTADRHEEFPENFQKILCFVLFVGCAV
jgi:hypothetical protein